MDPADVPERNTVAPTEPQGSPGSATSDEVTLPTLPWAITDARDDRSLPLGSAAR